MRLPNSESNAPGTRFLADLHFLAAPLGAPLEPDGTPAMPAVFQFVNSAASLRDFLEQYRCEILEPLELPAIQRAFLHAARHEVRELIAFDQELGARPTALGLAGASRRVGTAQLKSLRPLRDQRLVQRYLKAVETGQAHGWHTLVYGLGLQLYSLPLRQGLAGYAHQTMAGFIEAAAPRLRMTVAGAQEMLAAVTATLPAAVEKILALSDGLKSPRTPVLLK